MQALPAYEKLKSAGPVYLTFDMDVLDPAFAPGVWHREPGECWCERRLRIYMRLRERS
jgi:arginase family enzyme